MSAAGDPQSHEPDVSAAELALGLLEGDERAAALRRVLAEPAFAREVEAWRARFGEMFETWPEMPAPVRAEERLARAIRVPAGDAGPVHMRFWKVWAAVASMAAAVLLLVVFAGLPGSGPMPSQKVPVAGMPSEKLLVAVIAPASGAAPVPALYRPSQGYLSLPANGLGQAGHSAQLWVIGGDGVPHSLGLLAPAAPTGLILSPATRQRMTGGAAIAVSIEPPGGSPTGLPTGPVVAKGILSIT